MLTDQISSVATVAVAGMHGRSPSVAALRLVDVRPRTGANRLRLLPATPTLTWRSLMKNPLRNDGLSQSRYHAGHPKIPAATEPTSDD